MPHSGTFMQLVACNIMSMQLDSNTKKHSQVAPSSTWFPHPVSLLLLHQVFPPDSFPALLSFWYFPPYLCLFHLVCPQVFTVFVFWSFLVWFYEVVCILRSSSHSLHPANKPSSAWFPCPLIWWNQSFGIMTYDSLLQFLLPLIRKPERCTVDSWVSNELQDLVSLKLHESFTVTSTPHRRRRSCDDSDMRLEGCNS